MKKGYIRVEHLVYIIIIALIVISFFLVISFGNSENASTTMGTASTVSSLILSVIAIVLSLIDVAGQRESMVDLKETSEKLAESNDKSQELIQTLISNLDDITLLKDQLIDQIKTNNEWRDEIKNLILTTNNKTNEEPEDAQKLLNELKEKIIAKYSSEDSKVDYDYTLYLNNNDNKRKRPTSKSILLDAIQKLFNGGEIVEEEILVNKLQRVTPLSRDLIMYTLNRLHLENKIKFIKKDNQSCYQIPNW